MCVQVLEMGGNAVVGYRQDFDLEGETGMVARGIGTVVSLVGASTPMSEAQATASVPVVTRSRSVLFVTASWLFAPNID